MKKKYKVFIILDIFMLVFLFLVSSTDIFVNEKEGEVYNICVFADCYKDGHIDNFRLGVDKASSAYNIDLNFINLREYENVNEKISLVSKEIENECQGIIIACGNDYVEEKILEAIQKYSIPVVLYNGQSENSVVKGVTGPNTDQEATLIYLNIEQKVLPSEKIFIFEYTDSSEYTKEVHDSLRKILDENGYENETVVAEYKEDIHSAVDKITRHKMGSIVSADSRALEDIGAECSYYGSDIFICGAGWSGDIRNYIENGVIEFVVAHTSYEAGYGGMEKLICSIENKAYDKINEIKVKSVVVNKENMYSKEIEPVIFPFS